MKKNILALQFKTNLNSVEANFETVEKLYMPCDILFLPEVWSMGWFCKDFIAKAKSYSGATIDFLKNFAQKNNVNIIGGSYIRETSNGFKNSMPVILRNGEVLLNYDKVHLFTPDGEDCLTPGDKPKIIDLEGLKIGLSICFDIRFPEFYRSFNPMPELLINLSAWPKTRTHHYFHLCHARAIENQAYFLGLSQCGEITNGVFNAGNSLLIDCFGKTLEQLGSGEGSIFAQIDTDKVKDIREKFPNLKMRKTKGLYENY